VSLAGFRVFGFVGARGVIFLINGTLSQARSDASRTGRFVPVVKGSPKDAAGGGRQEQAQKDLECANLFLSINQSIYLSIH